MPGRCSTRRSGRSPGDRRPVRRARPAGPAGPDRRRHQGRLAPDRRRHPPRPRRRRRPRPVRRRGSRLHRAAHPLRPGRGLRRPNHREPGGGRPRSPARRPSPARQPPRTGKDPPTRKPPRTGRPPPAARPSPGWPPGSAAAGPAPRSGSRSRPPSPRRPLPWSARSPPRRAGGRGAHLAAAHRPARPRATRQLARRRPPPPSAPWISTSRAHSPVHRCDGQAKQDQNAGAGAQDQQEEDRERRPERPEMGGCRIRQASPEMFVRPCVARARISVEHLQAVDVGVYGLPSYEVSARTLETRARTSSTLSVTMACMDSSISKV